MQMGFVRMNNNQKRGTCDDKETQYYASLCNAWVQTKFEFDKYLFHFSGLALGVLVIFLSDNLLTDITFIFWILAGLFFLLSVVCLFLIFRKNADLIENEIKGNSEQIKKCERTLLSLSVCSIIMFILGVLFTIVLCVSYYHISNNKEDFCMSEKRKINNESLGGIGNLNPNKEPLKKGLEGISRIKPTSSDTTTNTTTNSSANTPPNKDKK